MIGIDITSWKRFENKKENFFKKYLSENEYINYQNNKDDLIYCANIWSIKEAMFKADNNYHNFHNIDIKILNGRFIHPNFEISTSRENEYIVAMVIKKEEKHG